MSSVSPQNTDDLDLGVVIAVGKDRFAATLIGISFYFIWRLCNSNFEQIEVSKEEIPFPHPFIDTAAI